MNVIQAHRRVLPNGGPKLKDLEDDAITSAKIDGMTRMQVQLTEEQIQGLKKLATQQDCSISELVRQAVNGLLLRNDEAEEEKWRRATAAIGRFSSGLTDVAERHDDYLDEAYGS